LSETSYKRLKTKGSLSHWWIISAGSITFQVDFDILAPLSVRCPCAKSVFGNSKSAERSIAGQNAA